MEIIAKELQGIVFFYSLKYSLMIAAEPFSVTQFLVAVLDILVDFSKLLIPKKVERLFEDYDKFSYEATL